MYPNAAFQRNSDAQHREMARARGFGALVVPQDGAMPMISHVPFRLDEGGDEIELHLARPNPIVAAAQAGPLAAVIMVNGPDGYVSPDWYADPAHGQVPTWNYVTVHFTGQLAAQPDISFREHLDRLTADFEARLAPKPPWLAEKMPSRKLEAMMRAMVVFRFAITGVEGTWKLNQNKDDAHRLGAAEQIRHSPVGHETEALSELMRAAGPIPKPG